MLIFIVYQILQVLLIPVVALYLLYRKAKGKPVFGNLRERFGFVSRVANNERSIWIHAVSVGEILSLERLIDQIKLDVHAVACYVTTGTVGGKKMATEKLRADYVSFLPFDFLVPMLLAFRRIKPKALIIMEAEIWPNLLMVAGIKKVPLYLLNARFNESSIKKNKIIRYLLSKMYQRFDAIFAQSDDDKKMFLELGVQEEKVFVLGNIKAFNVEVKQKEVTPAFALDAIKLSGEDKRTVLLVGSVHPGELDYYINLFLSLKPKVKNLKMIFAPRHFHWKNELFEKLAATGYKPFMWNDSCASSVFDEHDFLVVCKLGELFKLYPLADIFYLGGTFVPIGGHNLLEPAVWGCPSFVGPYHYNCRDNANQLEKHHALIKVETAQELLDQTERLLFDRATCEAMGRNASSWLQDEARVVSKNLERVFEKLAIK